MEECSYEDRLGLFSLVRQSDLVEVENISRDIVNLVPRTGL